MPRVTQRDFGRWRGSGTGRPDDLRRRQLLDGLPILVGLSDMLGDVLSPYLQPVLVVGEVELAVNDRRNLGTDRRSQKGRVSVTRICRRRFVQSCQLRGRRLSRPAPDGRRASAGSVRGIGGFGPCRSLPRPRKGPESIPCLCSVSDKVTSSFAGLMGWMAA
jgi:hypothetical protein